MSNTVDFTHIFLRSNTSAPVLQLIPIPIPELIPVPENDRTTQSGLEAIVVTQQQAAPTLVGFYNGW